MNLDLQRRGALLSAGVLAGRQLVWSAGSASAVEGRETPSSTVMPSCQVLESEMGRLQMMAPNGWKREVDKSPEKLIYAYSYDPSKIADFMAMRAEEIALKEIFEAQVYNATSRDLAASTWMEVLKGSLTPELMAGWIFAQGARADSDSAVQGRGGKAVQEQGEVGSKRFQDDVVDAKVVTAGPAGDALIFHVRTATREDRSGPTRFWSSKAVLRNGTIAISFVTAPEANWEPGFEGYDGAFLDGVARSLELLPTA